ncbi:hypothetical protein [Serratia marcescens]|jgi:hypothetical protein|uniref:hypothetical protein n=1 Tax=Serratia marcescens TaxID=615 RepID=UPI00313E38DA
MIKNVLYTGLISLLLGAMFWGYKTSHALVSLTAENRRLENELSALHENSRRLHSQSWQLMEDLWSVNIQKREEDKHSETILRALREAQRDNVCANQPVPDAVIRMQQDASTD